LIIRSAFVKASFQGGPTGEVIREGVSQRRSVGALIRLVPLDIETQYLGFIVCSASIANLAALRGGV
jgi:hypothetical protein